MDRVWVLTEHADSAHARRSILRHLFVDQRFLMVSVTPGRGISPCGTRDALSPPVDNQGSIEIMRAGFEEVETGLKKEPITEQPGRQALNACRPRPQSPETL